MKRVAVILWQSSLPADASALIDAAAYAARQEGKALHFYVLSADQSDGARYKHASVEYVAAIGWRRAWLLARLLQRLLGRYDLTFIAGLSPVFTFLCRDYRLQIWSCRGGKWVAHVSTVLTGLLGCNWYPATGSMLVLADLLAGVATVYNENSSGEELA